MIKVWVLIFVHAFSSVDETRIGNFESLTECLAAGTDISYQNEEVDVVAVRCEAVEYEE